MAEGTIKKIVADRGFGFISAEDGKEYFFHRSAVANFDSWRRATPFTCTSNLLRTSQRW